MLWPLNPGLTSLEQGTVEYTNLWAWPLLEAGGQVIISAQHHILLSSSAFQWGALSDGACGASGFLTAPVQLLSDASWSSTVFSRHFTKGKSLNSECWFLCQLFTPPVFIQSFCQSPAVFGMSIFCIPFRSCSSTSTPCLTLFRSLVFYVHGECMCICAFPQVNPTQIRSLVFHSCFQTLWKKHLNSLWRSL